MFQIPSAILPEIVQLYDVGIVLDPANQEKFRLESTCRRSLDPSQFGITTYLEHQHTIRISILETARINSSRASYCMYEAIEIAIHR